MPDPGGIEVARRFAVKSTRGMASYIARTEGVSVSHHYVAKLWRDKVIQPHRQATFNISNDPEFADKVADIVGLYLEPPGGAGRRRR